MININILELSTYYLYTPSITLKSPPLADLAILKWLQILKGQGSTGIPPNDDHGIYPPNHDNLYKKTGLYQIYPFLGVPL